MVQPFDALKELIAPVHFRSIFESYLSKEDAYKCALWAFGEKFEEIPVNELPNQWNELHRDLMELRGNGKLSVDIKNIVELWQMND